MLYFISEQTSWYNKQAKAIEATIHTCKMETPEGRYNFWLKKQMAIEKFAAITQLCFLLTGESEASRAMSEIIFTTSQIINAEKEKSLLQVPRPEIHFRKGNVPNMLWDGVFTKGARKEEFEVTKRVVAESAPTRAGELRSIREYRKAFYEADKNSEEILKQFPVQEKGTDRRGPNVS